MQHIHDAEEIRFIIKGSGYFDVRDTNDKWIRIHVKGGDLMTLPEGIYHRFTCDEKDYIHAMRLFIGQPVWTPFNRPCDEHESREKYVEAYITKSENKGESEPPQKKVRKEEDVKMAATLDAHLAQSPDSEWPEAWYMTNSEESDPKARNRQVPNVAASVSDKNSWDLILEDARGVPKLLSNQECSLGSQGYF